VGKAKNGAQIADSTAEALQKIVKSVGKITELIGDIAFESKDQAERIYQINQELKQIDQITQANTANAEETAATSEELAGQTAFLEELLDNFKVDEESNKTYMVTGRSAGNMQQLFPAD
jgi:methyl-accepting chemotaxis protein